MLTCYFLYDTLLNNVDSSPLMADGKAYKEFFHPI